MLRVTVVAEDEACGQGWGGGGLAGFSSEPVCVRYDVVCRMMSLGIVVGDRGCG